MSADPRTGELSSMVGVTLRDGRSALLVGPYGGDLAEVLPGERPSPRPTVAATRDEFWTVRDGTEVVRVPADGQPQPVRRPQPARRWAGVSALQLSPDGVRAAVVVNGNQLFVGTVVRAEDAPVTLRDLRPVAPSLTGVTDVAWSGADRLLVLASGGPVEGVAPYSLGRRRLGPDRRPDRRGCRASRPASPPRRASSRWSAPAAPADDVAAVRGHLADPGARAGSRVPGTEPFFPA